jgi:hypothetical protein
VLVIEGQVLEHVLRLGKIEVLSARASYRAPNARVLLIIVHNYRLKLTKKFNKMKQTLGKKLLQTNGKLFIIKPFQDLNESNLIERISETYFLTEKVIKNFFKHRVNFNYSFIIFYHRILRKD